MQKLMKFSKRNNGMGSFSCTSDGNNRGTIVENVAEKIQHSEEPKKSCEAEDYDYQQNYVADEAKGFVWAAVDLALVLYFFDKHKTVVGGGDMDHDFFFGDGTTQNDPNKPMVTGSIPFLNKVVSYSLSVGYRQTNNW